MKTKWLRTIGCMGFSHKCIFCNREMKSIGEELYLCEGCGRIRGWKDDERLEEIERITNKRKAGRPKGSQNRKRLERLGLLKGEKNEKKAR